MLNRVRIVSVSLAGVGDGLHLVSLVARRLVNLAFMSLVRLRDCVITVTLEPRGSATGGAEAFRGRTLPAIGETSLSIINSIMSVGLLPVVPLLSHSG